MTDKSYSPYETIETNIVAITNDQPTKENGHQPDTVQIRLDVTQEKVERTKWGVFRKAQKGDTEAQYSFVARFMVDEHGRPLSKEAAYDILDELEIRQLNDVFDQINKAARNAAAPK